MCKLNPVTTDEDLELIFSRFGEIKRSVAVSAHHRPHLISLPVHCCSCEIIRDWKTGDSLCYAFIEFADEECCINAFSKMDNVLIDDRRIKVRPTTPLVGGRLELP